MGYKLYTYKNRVILHVSANSLFIKYTPQQIIKALTNAPILNEQKHIVGFIFNVKQENSLFYGDIVIKSEYTPACIIKKHTATFDKNENLSHIISWIDKYHG
jgi:hypothetical protein